jgi:hypothetical protein
LRSEQLVALLQETQGLAHDLVDRLEAPGLDLGANPFLDFVGQRTQVDARK